MPHPRQVRIPLRGNQPFPFPLTKRTQEGPEIRLNRSPVILFPHSHLTAHELEKMLSHFDPLVVYQPWFMADPLPSTQKRYADAVHVRYPPLHLKPKPGFKELLSEYRGWIRHNQDRGYAAFLQAIQNTGPSEKTPWEIRLMIRKFNAEVHDQLESRALKWHLILHLAREIIENRREEAEMITEIRRKGSPLKAALGEEIPSQNLLDDLPHLPAHAFLQEGHLAQVIEAWFGLFGGTLPDRARLITMDPQVMNFIAEIVENSSLIDPTTVVKATPGKPAERQTHIIQYHIPRLTRQDGSLPDVVLSGLSEKTIALVDETDDWIRRRGK